ncbi:hypothetical protein BH24ACT4_BH24ACT4_24420 [soil metagenome]
MLGVLRRPRGAQLEVRVAGATPWTRRNFVRWMFEDFPAPSWPPPTGGIEVSSPAPAPTAERPSPSSVRLHA